MLESIINSLQVISLIICLVYSFIRFHKNRDRAWGILVFFFGSFLLGNLYWQACLIYFGETPQVSVVSDMSWYAAYLFLFLLLREKNVIAAERNAVPENLMKSCLPFLAPVFTVFMAVFYLLQSDRLVSNIIWAALMGIVMFTAIKGLIGKEGQDNYKPLCLMVLIFCLLEYGSWTSSFYWEFGSVPQHIYYGFDLLMTFSFPWFIRAMQNKEAGL